MAISTFTELKTAVDNWLARTDLAGRAPEFIALAEARMNREIETRSQETRITSTLTAGDEYVSLPNDVRRIRHVRLNTSPITNLSFMTPLVIDRTHSSTGQGKPQNYSVIGTEIYFRPIPDAAYTAEIAYVASIEPLSDSVATNNILTRHPDIYLHGALAEAFGFLMDPQRRAQHDALFLQGLKDIQDDEDRARFAGGALSLTTDYGELT
tara:strand:+ start:1598 stop:2227 length:630 start_codon:yes stop_codon:yes gene_type:complete